MADDTIFMQYREAGLLLFRGFTLQECADQVRVRVRVRVRVTVFLGLAMRSGLRLRSGLGLGLGLELKPVPSSKVGYRAHLVLLLCFGCTFAYTRS